MRSEDRTTRVRQRAPGTRLLLAALLVGSTFAGIQQASARPTHGDLQAAKSQLDALNQRMDGLVEQYDQAQIALSSAQQHLAQAKAEVSRAVARAQAARHNLAAETWGPYDGQGGISSSTRRPGQPPKPRLPAAPAAASRVRRLWISRYGGPMAGGGTGDS